MDPLANHELYHLVRRLEGLACWYVSTGGGAGSTFQLAFGGRVPRRQPIRNPAHSEEYRHFEGEGNLLVWCAWRLDGEDHPLTSWDDAQEVIPAQLGKLIGRQVQSITLARPAWDLAVRFSGGLLLRLFADHVPGDPSFDGNWEVWLPQVAAFVGPGAEYAIEARSEAAPSVPPLATQGKTAASPPETIL